ncbi:MAG: thioesterase family protein [Chloroflexota bacterium]
MARITIAIDELRKLPQTDRMTVGEEHLDLMGHMNTMHYWELFSRASRNVTSLTGVTAAYVEEHQRGAFMLRNFTQFIAEAHTGDELTVYTRMVARGSKRFQCMHFMVNETRNTLAATMEVLSTHASLTERRSAVFPPHIGRKIDLMIATHNEIDWTDAPLSGILSPR